jgi:hypothetical protein
MYNFRIVNVLNGLYWSNETGWGSQDTADMFRDWEVLALNLPIDGAWERIIDG